MNSFPFRDIWRDLKCKNLKEAGLLNSVVIQNIPAIINNALIELFPAIWDRSLLVETQQLGDMLFLVDFLRILP